MDVHPGADDFDADDALFMNWDESMDEPQEEVHKVTPTSQQPNSACPEAYRLKNFSIYQSGIDVKCPYSTRPLKPLTPLLGVWQGLCRGP
jgi:hypothetical protein